MGRKGHLKSSTQNEVKTIIDLNLHIHFIFVALNCGDHREDKE